mmetsp:Transcript_61950/g.115831  ORF Transcript_61950/g.115831 Transcript_61950/m.115831 type:complete len:222 (+) Transcript_61950:85-750(+)
MERAIAEGVKKGLKEEAGSMLPSFIPQQVGGPTQYAMNHRHWMHLILFLQAAACILRGVVLFDLLGCFWMGLICALGYYAWYHDMNITYISIWGAACALNTVLDILGFVIPVATGLIQLELLSSIVRIGTPCTEILGALFAWHLYREYQISRGMQPVSNFDPLGRTFDDQDVENNPFFKNVTAAGSYAEHFVQDRYGSTSPFETSSPFQTGPPRQENKGCC